MRLSILIPAFQEERTIAEVVRRARALSLAGLNMDVEIIVVEDGSTDGTADEIRRAAEGDPRVRMIRHDRNQGKGAAIRTALAAATGDICIVQDADLEYSFDDYPSLLAPLQGEAQVVYGSRFLHQRWPSGMQAAHFVANRLLTLTANVLFGQRITDEATCFKVFRTDLLRSLDLECTGFEFCPEVTAKLGRRHIPIVEVPIHYQARGKESGKKVRWTDGFEAMATLFKYRFRRASPPGRLRP